MVLPLPFSRFRPRLSDRLTGIFVLYMFQFALVEEYTLSVIRYLRAPRVAYTIKVPLETVGYIIGAPRVSWQTLL